MVKILLGCIAFMLIGCWFVISPPVISNRYWSDPLTLRFVGTASIVFSGFGCYFFSKKLGDKQPGLMIDEKGIFDNSSFVAAGQLAWDDITSMALLEIKNQKMILLQMKDPQAIIDRQTNVLKRKLMKVNHSSYGSPVSFSASSLDISFTELWDLLADRIQTSRNNKGEVLSAL